ncbi:MAG: class I SAM-dependent methyltransferase [Rhodospirillales bacterium]|nr:class I SAM-dependent methyltransferase [Rhodospirillales bacterium]
MSLEDSLRRRIAHSGPITVAEYMTEALSHPKYGYYMSRNPFGQEGDFITAPEISQMFGELLGFWCAALWQQMGSPSEIKLIEMGPGRGTLMNDALRAAQNVPGFSQSLSIHMIETSPVLRERQRESLSQFDLPIEWHNTLAEVPDGPMLLLANELLDALPIRQYVFKKGYWHEIMVEWEAEKEALSFALSPLPIPADHLSSKGSLPVKEGDVAEVCPAGLSLGKQIGERLAAFGGGGLLIDYGYSPSGFGDTFQAVKDHKFHPVLETPGQADLTAHVDFSMIGEAATQGGGKVYGTLSQGEFLQRLGIETRAQTLLKTANGKQRKVIESGLHRLIDPKEMGTLFKVLALGDPSLQTLPGF